MAKPSNISISEGLEALADKLARLADGERVLQKIVVETTLEAKERLIDRITNDIAPHSGLSRERNPQPVVTDLVDTGFYRASWQSSFPGPLVGKVSTNAEYALPLEYGSEDGSLQAFYPARDTAREMTPIFAKKMADEIRETLK